MKLKSNVTVDEMFELLDARLGAMQRSLLLWWWRVLRMPEQDLRDLEVMYGKSLDRLWEAQERCREI